MLIWVLVGASALLVVVASLSRARGGGPRRSRASMIKVMRRLDFFGALADEQINAIVNVTREVHVPPDIFVIREHRADSSLYIVTYGSLQILKRGALQDNLVQTVGPGEVIGEMAALTGARRVASARTTTPCSLFEIDHDDLLEVLGRDPGILKVFWDACERHTIRLAMADLEQTREMPLARRDPWIAARVSVETTRGMVLAPPAAAAYLAVIAGAVEVDGVTIEPPRLIALGSARMTAKVDGRVCWLLHSRR